MKHWKYWQSDQTFIIVLPIYNMRIFCKNKFAINKFSQTFFEISPFLPLFTTTTNGLVSQIFFFDPYRCSPFLLKNPNNKNRFSGSDYQKFSFVVICQIYLPQKAWILVWVFCKSLANIEYYNFVLNYNIRWKILFVF